MGLKLLSKATYINFPKYADKLLKFFIIVTSTSVKIDLVYFNGDSCRRLTASRNLQSSSLFVTQN